MRKLRDYQQRAVTALYESDGLVAVMPMGAGKTAVTLHAIDELVCDGAICNALVLAPKRVAEITWPAELAEWPFLSTLNMAVVSGSPAKRAELLADYMTHDIHVVGIDNTQWLVEQLKGMPADSPLFDLLVIDEISRFKSPTGARYQALMKIIGRFRNVWALTGTPRPNSSMDLFAPASIVSKSKLWGRSFYKWRQKRFYTTDYQGYIWAPLPGAEASIAEDFATIAFRLDDADMPDLPEMNEVESWVRLPAGLQREYDRMQRQLFAELTEGELLADSTAIATGKLAQFCQGFAYRDDGDGGKATEELHELKLDWLKDLVETLEGEPLIVFYDFQADQARLRQAFPQMKFLADFNGSAASWVIDDWNKGRLPLLALHPASAGHGLNLQHGGSKAAWYGLTWSAELYDQACKRLHRPGQKHNVTIFHCLVDGGTVDTLKRDRVIGKMTAQDAFRRWLRAV